MPPARLPKGLPPIEVCLSPPPPEYDPFHPVPGGISSTNGADANPSTNGDLIPRSALDRPSGDFTFPPLYLNAATPLGDPMGDAPATLLLLVDPPWDRSRGGLRGKPCGGAMDRMWRTGMGVSAGAGMARRACEATASVDLSDDALSPLFFLESSPLPLPR